MTKSLFKVLLVLAALLISSPSYADDTSTVSSVPIDTVSIPVIQPLPPIQPLLRIKRGEVCPPIPAPSDPWPAVAVSLVGGCQTTSEQQLHYARGRQLALMTTFAEYQERIANGYFVPLEGPYLQVLANRPYALPSTVAFVREMSTAYYAAGCGRLVVRDALRLITERPSNGSVHSVHPSGMAIDLRVRDVGEVCENWMNKYLIAKEAEGKVDATREYWKIVRGQHLPNPHFHIVVPIEAYPPSQIHVSTPSHSVGAP